MRVTCECVVRSQHDRFEEHADASAAGVNDVDMEDDDEDDFHYEMEEDVA